MSTENSVKDLPQNLELNDWLRLSLSSQNEISRHIALEEMITNGFSSDFNDALKEIAEKDSSQVCRSQAQWLLKLADAKSSLKSIIKMCRILLHGPHIAHSATWRIKNEKIFISYRYIMHSIHVMSGK